MPSPIAQSSDNATQAEDIIYDIPPDQYSQFYYDEQYDYFPEQENQTGESLDSEQMTQMLYDLGPRDPADKRRFHINGSPVAEDDRLQTTTTLAKQCGGMSNICLVDFRTGGVGQPLCCDQDNNDACMGCLQACKSTCIMRGTGVESCFMEGNIPRCICTREEPLCYSMEIPKTETEINHTLLTGTEDASMPWFSYLLIAGFLIMALVFSIEFVHRADRQ